MIERESGFRLKDSEEEVLVKIGINTWVWTDLAADDRSGTRIRAVSGSNGVRLD